MTRTVNEHVKMSFKSISVLIIVSSVIFASTVIFNVNQGSDRIIRQPMPKAATNRTLSSLRFSNTTQVRTKYMGANTNQSPTGIIRNAITNNPIDVGMLTNSGVNPQTVVIIVTNKRSGSSFLGELFNQNPDVFYLFEPLFYLTMMALHNKITGDSFDTLSTEVLRDISVCDFEAIPYTHKWWNASNKLHSCSNSDWSTLCPVTRAIQLPINVVMQQLRKICHSHRTIAIKTIRLADIAYLRDFVADKNINLKILHLVRDPRAVMNSRLKLHAPNLEFQRKRQHGVDEVTDLCRHMTHNLRYISTRPHWLIGRYKLVRFEDLANEPDYTGREIYNFVGLQFTRELGFWIGNHTTQASKGPHSTSRVSSTIINQWRHEIDFEIVNDIQHKCISPMASLGYTLMADREELMDIQQKESYYSKSKELPLSLI